MAVSAVCTFSFLEIWGRTNGFPEPQELELLRQRSVLRPARGETLDWAAEGGSPYTSATREGGTGGRGGQGGGGVSTDLQMIWPALFDSPLLMLIRENVPQVKSKMRLTREERERRETDL